MWERRLSRGRKNKRIRSGRNAPLSPLMRAFGSVHERPRRIKRPGLDNDKPHRGVISQEARTILRSVGTCYRRRSPRSVIKHDDVTGSPPWLSRRAITLLIIGEEKERTEGGFTLSISSREKVAHSMNVIRVIAAVSLDNRGRGRSLTRERIESVIYKNDCVSNIDLAISDVWKF